MADASENFYIFSTGIQTIAANTRIDISNIMFSQFPIELGMLTLYIDPTITQVQRQNLFVNFKGQGDTKWEFDSEYVPIEFIAGTPSYPYILKNPLLLYQNYLNIKFDNQNAATNIPLCIAFMGKINMGRAENEFFNPDLTTKINYNYQITDPVVGTGITANNGVLTLPAGPSANLNTFFLNQFEPYFEIKRLWQWLTPPLDAAITLQLDRYAIPLINNPTPMAQIFGTPDEPFNMPYSWWMKNNERMTMSFTYATPLAFPVAPNFSGFLYREKENNLRGKR